MKIVIFNTDENFSIPDGVVRYDIVPPKIGNVFPEDAIFLGLAEDYCELIAVEYEEILSFLIQSGTEHRVNDDGSPIDIQELATDILNLTL